MKIVAKCLAFEIVSYKAHVKVCNPIPSSAVAEVYKTSLVHEVINLHVLLQIRLI